MKVVVASSCAVLPTPRRRRRRSAAFTLPEVMVALAITTMMCLSAFAGLRLVSRLAMTTAVRSEAHRLLQAEAERLMSVDYSAFAASSDRTETGTLKTLFRPNAQNRFDPVEGAQGRVTYVTRVVAVTSTTTTRTLRVEVQWTWLGKSQTISVPLYRSM